MRLISKIRPCAALGIVLALALPALAGADPAKRDRARDVRAPGLKAKQRNALDIARLDATGVPFGLVVTATMRGNAGKVLGRGRLKNATVALVLDTARGRGKDRVIAATGRRGRRVVANLPRRNPFAAVVDGRRVTFVAVGVDLRKVRAVKIVTLVRSRSRRRRAPARRTSARDAQSGTALERLLDDVLSGGASDVVFLLLRGDVRRALSGSIDPPTTCKQLNDRFDALERLNRALSFDIVDRGPSPTVTRLRQVASEVRKRLDEIEAEIARRPQPCTGATIIEGGGDGDDGGAGPDRTCAFAHDKTGSDRFLLYWRCDQAHSSVLFDFNAAVTSIDPSVGNAQPPVCQIDSADPSLVRCNGSFQAGGERLFSIQTTAPQSCPTFSFVANVDGTVFPEKPCVG